jgi:hypothetical protein
MGDEILTITRQLLPNRIIGDAIDPYFSLQGRIFDAHS